MSKRSLAEASSSETHSDSSSMSDDLSETKRRKVHESENVSGSRKTKQEQVLAASKPLGIFKVFIELKPLIANSSNDEATKEECSGSSSLLGEAIHLRLTHKHTLRTFEGDFDKEDVVNIGFDSRNSLTTCMKVIRDAFDGTHPDISLQCGFAAKTTTETSDIKQEFFDGCTVLVCVRERYRHEVYDYKLRLLPANDSTDELQARVNQSLRTKVSSLEQQLTETKKEMVRFKRMFETASAEMHDKFEDCTREMRQEISALKRELAKDVTSRVASIESCVRRHDALRSLRTLSCFCDLGHAQIQAHGVARKRSSISPIYTQLKKGVCGLSLTSGCYGDKAADKCPFAQLRDGRVLFLQTGDYAFSAKIYTAFDITALELMIDNGRKRRLATGPSVLSRKCAFIDRHFTRVSKNSVISLEVDLPSDASALGRHADLHIERIA